jgi:hypothetical protein
MRGHTLRLKTAEDFSPPCGRKIPWKLNRNDAKTL